MEFKIVFFINRVPNTIAVTTGCNFCTCSVIAMPLKHPTHYKSKVFAIFLVIFNGAIALVRTIQAINNFTLYCSLDILAFALWSKDDIK